MKSSDEFLPSHLSLKRCVHARLQPGKVLSKKQMAQQFVRNCVIAQGILKINFSYDDLVDMRDVVFPILQDIVTECLAEITIIQAMSCVIKMLDYTCHHHFSFKLLN